MPEWREERKVRLQTPISQRGKTTSWRAPYSAHRWHAPPAEGCAGQLSPQAARPLLQSPHLSPEKAPGPRGPRCCIRCWWGCWHQGVPDFALLLAQVVPQSHWAEYKRGDLQRRGNRMEARNSLRSKTNGKIKWGTQIIRAREGGTETKSTSTNTKQWKP